MVSWKVQQLLQHSALSTACSLRPFEDVDSAGRCGTDGAAGSGGDAANGTAVRLKLMRLVLLPSKERITQGEGKRKEGKGCGIDR